MILNTVSNLTSLAHPTAASTYTSKLYDKPLYQQIQQHLAIKLKDEMRGRVCGPLVRLASYLSLQH